MTTLHDGVVTLRTTGRTAPKASRRSGSSFWLTVAGVALSIACLYIGMRGTDLREIGSALRSAHLWLALPFILAQVLFYAAKAVRWRLLLLPIHSTATKPLVAPMMIGFMGNNLLPAHLGEFIRMYLGARLLGIAQSQVLATLLLERMFDFIAVLVFLCLSVVVLRSVPENLVLAGYLAAAVSAVSMLGAIAYVVWTRPVLSIAEGVTRFLPARVSRGILHQLELGASGMAALRQPRLLFWIVATSLFQWLVMAACIYLSFRAVDIDVPLSAAFVVLAATVFGVMVPAAPGFFGTLHLTFVLALTPFHIDQNRAMAAAVFYHIIPYVGVTLVGLSFMRQMGVRLQDIDRKALEGTRNG